MATRAEHVATADEHPLLEAHFATLATRGPSCLQVACPTHGRIVEGVELAFED